MKKLIANKKIIFIFILIGIYSIIYTQFRSYATLNFNINILQSKTLNMKGELFFSKNAEYNQKNSKNFFIHKKEINKTHHYSIDINKKNIKYLRLDPLPINGEFILSNVYIINSNGRFKVDLNQIQDNSYNKHNIKILNVNSNNIHIKANGNDPYFELIKDYSVSTNRLSTIKILTQALVSLVLTLLTMFIIYNQYIKLEHILLTIIIIIGIVTSIIVKPYYTNIHNYLLISIACISTFIIILHGLRNYVYALKTSIILLTIFSILIYTIDIYNGEHFFNRYLNFLPYIIASIIIGISFIQKNYFNKNYFKYILLILTIGFSLIIILHHYNLLFFDNIIINNYSVVIYDINKKQYEFFYILMMWTTISFFNIKKRIDFIIVVLILIISGVNILNDYPFTTKLIYQLSIPIYILLNIYKIKLKHILILPKLLVLYIITSPLWINFLCSLEGLHHKLDTRINIYKIGILMIERKPFLGYGFDSANYMSIEKYLDYNLVKEYINSYTTHNMLNLLWLNFGLIGILFFSFIFYFGLKKIIIASYNTFHQPAILMLVFSFIIIVTFNWSAWWSTPFTTYAFFIGFVLLSLNQIKKEVK